MSAFDFTFTTVASEELIYAMEPRLGPGPVAIFDLDHTLVRPKGGRTFPRGADDYEYLYPHTVATLRGLVREEGYALYIVTNQGSLMRAKKREALQDFLTKIRSIAVDLEIPFSICIACGDNWYRKPHRGAIALLEEKGGWMVDRSRSFYCGDALGRRGDFAASDLYFAHNNGLRIFSPEGFFEGSERREFAYHLPKRPYLDPLFDKGSGIAFLERMKDLLERDRTGSPVNPGSPGVSRLIAGGVMVILTGSPASGKTTLAQFLQKKYPVKVISSDDFSTKTAMERAVREELSKGRSVIVDATHPSRESRKKWIAMGKSAGAGARYEIVSICIPFQPDLIEHLRHYRIEVAGSRGGAEEVVHVPAVALRVFQSRFERPTKAEGFDQVIEYVPFLEIQNAQEEEIFHLYYL
jgi:bifunctional polynucleotide phosphatase/kinase